jgi:phosphatidate cytidylyltransferase
MTMFDIWHDSHCRTVLAIIGAVLIGASVITASLSRGERGKTPLMINLRARVVAWWWMVALVVMALSLGFIATVVFFAFVSFLALREFITLAPTKRGDHRALFSVFFIALPMHYVLIAWPWYQFWAIFIPVYAFAFVAIRSALAGDCERYLERNSKIQFGLMACIYAIGHLPAFLVMGLPEGEIAGMRLLLWLLLVVQLSDVLQYVWGKLFGRKPVIPRLSPHKTWAGFLGGITSATIIGTGLWWLTPLLWYEASVLALIATLLGFCGGAVMSAIKRDVGVKDFGHAIGGHGGILDRIDSLIFSGPVVYHLIRWWLDLP